MSFTFNHLRELTCMKDLKLLTPECSLDKEIRWPYITETVKFRQWTHGKELLIVTSAVSSKWDYNLYTVIQEAVASHLSGALLLIGEEYVPKTDISPKIIDFATANDFPIATIPWKVPLVDILEEISTAIIHNSSHTALSESSHNNSPEDASDTLLSLALSEESHPITELSPLPCYRLIQITISPRLTPSELQMLCQTLQPQVDNPEFWAVKEHSLFLYLPLEKDSTAASVSAASVSLCSIFSKALSNNHYLIGISALHHKESGLLPSISECKEIIAVLSSLGTTDRSCFYEDFSIYKYFFQTKDQRALIDYANRVLMPLLQYDLQNRTELYSSLRAYCLENFNILNTAARLYIHRNTMRYRLEKIENILGRNLDCFSTQLDVGLGVMIYEVFGKTKT